MINIPFEIPPLPIKKIDEIKGRKATIILIDNRVISGYGDCILPLPIDDDDSETDDYLDFVKDNGESEFLRDEDIRAFTVK